MLKFFKIEWKKKLYKIRSFIIAKLSKYFLSLLAKTCRFKFEGFEEFSKLATSEKCILMLWHNRLAITPYILNRYTPQLIYAPLISGSRDGDILSNIVLSYANGRVIRVAHQDRYRALREAVRHVEERKQIVIITPDGPKGPCYQIKPGIAVAALETEAHVVIFDWEADHYWELNTWDRLRFPKPFTTIHVKFTAAIQLKRSSPLSLEDAKTILKNHMPAY